MIVGNKIKKTLKITIDYRPLKDTKWVKTSITSVGGGGDFVKNQRMGGILPNIPIIYPIPFGEKFSKKSKL